MFKSTLFLALQCCQCSTMQVKQQRKSSNKWTCVVCNQKQSIRKIYAEGYQAKDIRQFVQSSNMSRKEADDQATFDLYEEDSSLGQFVEHLEGDHLEQEQKPSRRTDWSEYIENEEDSDPTYLNSLTNGGEMFEPEIVTEIPDGAKAKKAKLKGKFDGSSFISASDGMVDNLTFKHHEKSSILQVKVARKEANCANNIPGTAKRVWNQDEREQPNHQKKRMTIPKKSGSKWSEYMMDEESHCSDEEELQVQKNKNKQTTFALTSATKLSEYMKDDEDQCLESRKATFEDDFETMYGHDLETDVADETVEEDVHPDFL